MKLRLPVDIVVQLFGQLVKPILLCGCEVWGFENCTQIEVFHRQFCKRLLKLNKATSNCMVYGELGQGRLHVKRAGGGANFLERALYQVIRSTHKGRGVGTIFFLGGGGKSVDLPSDCQILGGGHRHIHPIETKSWGGNCPLAPPPRLPRPCTKALEWIF